MKTLYSVLITGLFIIATAIIFPSEAAADTMTNMQFAELIVSTTGLEVPAGTEGLSDEEYFEVMANLLAANGIDYFVGADANAGVTYENFINLLYALLGIDGELSFEEKRQFLADLYETPWGNIGDIVNLAQATEALNNPAYAALVAEGYSGAGGPGRGAGNAPGYGLENTNPPGVLSSTAATTVIP